MKPPARRIQLPFTTESKKKKCFCFFIVCGSNISTTRANNGDLLIIAFVRRVSKIVICPRFLFYLFAVTNYITLGEFTFTQQSVCRATLTINIWNANRNVFAINFGLLCQSQWAGYKWLLGIPWNVSIGAKLAYKKFVFMYDGDIS